MRSPTWRGRPLLPYNAYELAAAKRRDRKLLASEYEVLFMTSLRRMATRGKQTNILQHIVGTFKKLIDSNDRQEIQEVFASDRAGYVPLVVPLTLLKHHVRRHGIDDLAQESDLGPHPTELLLRNHG